ncbi:MAG: type II toxin-antitoxin system Phd/YefM family antitoxin [Bacteroidota bacterium]
MSHIHPTQDIRSLSDFRANAASLIKHVRQTRRPLVLTQHGQGTAVVLDAHEYERLIDELDLLRDVQAAEADLAAGGGLGHEAAKAQVLARLRQ